MAYVANLNANSFLVSYFRFFFLVTIQVYNCLENTIDQMTIIIQCWKLYGFNVRVEKDEPRTKLKVE